MSAAAHDVVLDVRDLRTHLFTRRGIGKPVDGVSFQLRAGRTLGLVGESGSGKSMTAVSLLQLHPQPAARIVSGQVLFKGEDLLRKPPAELRAYRGRHLAYVPQDPLSALNPVFTVGAQLHEAMAIHLRLEPARLLERAIGLLRRVHVPSPEERMRAFPHQLSGGTRQRVVSAMGIACDPEVLIADEPTTSLDVTVQAVYLDLLREIQRERGIAILFITHDFGIVANLCDEVAVMYAGRIVEHAPTRRLFEVPAHPYTQALLGSLPDPTVEVAHLPAIPGQPPSIFALPGGCPFAARCDRVLERCGHEYPPMVITSDAHSAACWRLAR